MKIKFHLGPKIEINNFNLELLIKRYNFCYSAASIANIKFLFYSYVDKSFLEKITRIFFVVLDFYNRKLLTHSQNDVTYCCLYTNIVSSSLTHWSHTHNITKKLLEFFSLCQIFITEHYSHTHKMT